MSSRASAGKELGGTSDSHRSGTELVCPLFLAMLSVAETGSVVTECCGKRRSYVHYPSTVRTEEKYEKSG